MFAETLEAVTWGAQLVQPEHQAEAPRMGLDQPGAFLPEKVGADDEANATKGDVEAALAAAATRLEPVYATPPQTHNPMEPHVTLAKKEYSMNAFGAVFAEVKVDPELGQIRTTRVVGAFAAGRLLNAKLARSQYLGGMV